MEVLLEISLPASMLGHRLVDALNHLREIPLNDGLILFVLDNDGGTKVTAAFQVSPEVVGGLPPEQIAFSLSSFLQTTREVVFLRRHGGHTEHIATVFDRNLARAISLICKSGRISLVDYLVGGETGGVESMKFRGALCAP